jgi:hypothetical protein
MRGVALKAVQELLGHATMDMTMRSAHLAGREAGRREGPRRPLERRFGGVQRHRDGTGDLREEKAPGSPGPRWSGKRDLNRIGGER